MGADLVVVIALLKQLGLLSEKDATKLFDELRYRNLSMSLKDCLKIIEDVFKSQNIGKKSETVKMIIGDKMLDIEK